MVDRFSAYLQSLDAGRLADYATVAGLILAVVSVVVALRQLQDSRRETRRTLALGAYKDYLILAMDNPQLSSPSYPKTAPRYHELRKDALAFERYEYFFSNLVHTAELILDVTKGQDRWKEELTTQFRFHALYIPGYLQAYAGNVDQAVASLMEKAVLEYKAEKA